MPHLIAINLASEPFTKRRPVILGALVAGLALVALLVLQIHLIVTERRQMAEAREAVAHAEAELRKLALEQGQLESFLRQPENAEVLDRNLLLNALIMRKAISWTVLFADLEKTMPHNVKLISIRPEVTPQNQISLQMMVGAQSSEPVLQLLKNLESSPLFGPSSVQNWLPPSQSEPLYRYRVNVVYGQKL